VSEYFYGKIGHSQSSKIASLRSKKFPQNAIFILKIPLEQGIFFAKMFFEFLLNIFLKFSKHRRPFLPQKQKNYVLKRNFNYFCD